ncbi:MAG: hypothetical protein II962_08555, partial [Spirochaetales bacterium]|nr:hypothetical protein [Spirochaetales bacterium]
MAVPNIFSVWEGKGWEKPFVEEQFNPDRTILTLPLVRKRTEKIGGKKQSEKVLQNKQKIVEFLSETNSAGINE